ncbi:MAG: hydrogenase nickel incorporation protein HypB [Candidatus Methanomethylophilaceae archaeon]|nr:hydrogenase nickel incorporation protein HypB [Candidatus Methanomethylophilaceae archaeon]
MHNITEIGMELDVLGENRRLAEENRSRLNMNGVRSVDIMGSIGSGKTALIIRMAEKLRQRGYKVAAIAGDVTGEDDFSRLRDAGVEAVNCNTGSECHLDAHLLEHALEHLDLKNVDVLFVENVGNLVCPADFPLGTDLRIVLVSVTEGDDMVRKHPEIFHAADMAAVNKVDLAEIMEVDVNRIAEDYERITGKTLYRLSVKKGEGIDELIEAMGL